MSLTSWRTDATFANFGSAEQPALTHTSIGLSLGSPARIALSRTNVSAASNQVIGLARSAYLEVVKRPGNKKHPISRLISVMFELEYGLMLAVAYVTAPSRCKHKTARVAETTCGFTAKIDADPSALMRRVLCDIDAVPARRLVCFAREHDA